MSQQRHQSSVHGLACGRSYTAMVTTQPTDGVNQNRFAVQVGRNGNFGRPIELDAAPVTDASAFLDPTGVVADRHGRHAVVWRRCNLDGSGCAIKALNGTEAGIFGEPQTVLAVASAPNLSVRASVADGAVGDRALRKEGAVHPERVDLRDQRPVREHPSDRHRN